ncbi:hypothetical protein BDZ45DRAFT_749615 [Acephala macrosclerotiorum]|nr:hypothetical protein BDZ45DRAFT_749615 [Acephala macrosclerotiorum]
MACEPRYIENMKIDNQVIVSSIDIEDIKINASRNEVHRPIDYLQLLVRILRGSENLQDNSMVHWGTWLGSTIGTTALAFIILVIPALMVLYMDRDNHKSGKRKMAVCGLHLFTIDLGSFITVSGTYTTVQSIIDAYSSGTVAEAFTC